MKSHSFKKDSFASGDIGPIIFCVVLVVAIMGLELSFGYGQFYEKFNNSQLHEDEIPVEHNVSSNWWDGIVDFFSSVADTVVNAITGFVAVLGIFWDLMTFNIEAFGDDLGILRIFLSIPIWACFFYMGAKIIRGF